MKIVLFGDSMFGRNNNHFLQNPFKNLANEIPSFKSATIIFNLETTISPIPHPETLKEDKVFNYQSKGKQLKQLRKLTKKPIITSISNNHSLDYSPYSYETTMRFLKANSILYSDPLRQNQPYITTNNLIFLNATDHCGCKNPQLWGNYVWMIDIQSKQQQKAIQEMLRKIRLLPENKNKIIVFSIHWGSNWLKSIPKKMQNFGRMLIDAGVNIVFGHSAHHIPPIPYEFYNNNLIIYGLGDAFNDYAVKPEYKSNECLICEVDFNKQSNKQSNNTLTVTRMLREMDSKTHSSIPKYVLSKKTHKF